MRSCFVLLFASLLTSCEAQGTIEPIGFVLKGRDLLLKLHDDPPEGFKYVDWKINEKVTLVRFDPSGKANVLHNVTERFEFPENKFSVILKNLQEADSGVYSAVALTSTVDKLVAEYKVTVQGPVSPVKLTVDRVESSSSESCDLHVTCRTHNSHISSTFRCVDQVCSQEGGERSEVTTSGASLQIYLQDTVIICDHRNQVNWTQDLVPAEHLCPSKPDLPSGWVAAICILVFGIVVLFFWLYIYRRRIIRDVRSFIEPIQNPAQTKRERQLLDRLNKKKASGEKMEELDLQLLDHLTMEAALGEKMTKRDLQLLNVLNKKAASGEMMTKRERRLLKELNKKKASGEMMVRI